MDDVAASVKGIVKALDTGIKLAKRVSKSANSSPLEQAPKISEAARSLQRALEESSKTVNDAYTHTLEQCGRAFTTALAEERSLQPKLKELRIDLIDQITECDFDEDEPDSFNPAAFKSLEEQADKCCNKCIEIFNELGNRLLQTAPEDQLLHARPKDDRAQLSSMRAISREGSPGNNPMLSSSQIKRPILAIDTPQAEPVKPRSPWNIDLGAQIGAGTKASTLLLNSTPVPQAPYRGKAPLSVSPISEYSTEETYHPRRQLEPPYPISPTDQDTGRKPSEVSPIGEQPRLINKEVVNSRLNQNEQFLERRRQSRLLFQNELRKSVSSIEETRTVLSFNDSSGFGSPRQSILLSPSIETSPIAHKGSPGRGIERPVSGAGRENRGAPTSRDGSDFSSPRMGHSTMLVSSVAQKGNSPSRSLERTIMNADGSGPWNEALVSLNDMPSRNVERDRSSESYIDGMSPPAWQSTSPIDSDRMLKTSGNSYDMLTSRQRSNGQSSQDTRSSRTSSILQDTQRPKMDRKDSHASQASQESIFGLRNAAPLSPPLSQHRISGNENWGHLASTLKVPGFGAGVEPGIEVVDHIDRDNGLILANEDQIALQPTPTASMKSVDYPMRHDSSFYKFGGFCDGAKALIRGDTGFKIMKRPSGHYSATVSARCIKCSYEVGWNDVEKDRVMDAHGIYGNSGIRFRQKFISKCHLRTNSIDEPMYACIFCIEEHRTVEEHDATVFYSVTKLFQHLAKHSQPVPNLAGLTILYGLQPPHVLDFDIHFTSPEPRFQQFSMTEIASKASSRPAAHATATHHPKNSRSSSRDPEGNPTLHFAAGARIVGITYPDRFQGQWCIGYHDGERGSFPASTIMLEMPVREDVLMNAQSTLVAFARWDFKPKDVKDGGWLKFSKGDRISAVGYTFQDQWCWSGQTGTGSKAKFGLFPAAFVEGLREEDGVAVGGKLGTSPVSVKSSGLGLSLGSIIGRHKNHARHERTASVRSSGSAGSGGGGIVAIPSGLEVVQSPLHSTGSWRT